MAAVACCVSEPVRVVADDVVKFLCVQVEVAIYNRVSFTSVARGSRHDCRASLMEAGEGIARVFVQFIAFVGAPIISMIEARRVAILYM